MYLPISDSVGDLVVNIGWLDKDHDFGTGPVPLALVAALMEQLDTPTNRARGYHLCNICDAREPVRVKHKDDEVLLGDVEIQIRRPGCVYVAPNLIIHYVTRHSYQPPDEFVTAVLGRDPT